MRKAWLGFAALLPTFAAAQLTRVERDGLDAGMTIGNLSESDLGFLGREPGDAYRMPIVGRALGKPVETADALMALHAQGDGTLTRALAAALRTAYGETPAAPKALAGAAEGPPVSIPEPLRPSLTRLIGALVEANAAVREATSRLSKPEARRLLETLPQWAAETPSLKFDFVKSPPLSRNETLALLKRVDLVGIRTAGLHLAQRVEAELPRLRALSRTVTMRGLTRFQSRGVTVEIGGQTNDLHASRDTNLCLDLGGDDAYSGRYGAGAGYASVLIDLGGDDVFKGPDLNVGAGVLGIGLAYDLGGNDRFDEGSVACGVGLAGVGALVKEAGDDRYALKALGQGFGLFGVGILMDTGGRDVYDAQVWAQGAGRTQGVGWLIDQTGDDVYRTAGLVPERAALGNAKGSFAQGCGRGFEDEDGSLSGGVGLLTDLGGDDVYLADTSAQAIGITGGLGSLEDVNGNDTYSLRAVGQAYAERGGAAFLFDLSGDDSYTVKGGLGHGTGANGGLAFLLDREGNDLYASHDARPGTGLSGGVGIFLDAAGDDRYGNAPGFAASGRATGSVGLFCDLGGTDSYAEGLEGGQAKGTDGIAYDAGSRGVAATNDAPAPGSLPPPNDTEFASLVRDAASGRSPAALKRLVGIGRPALDWVLAHRLGGSGEGMRRLLGGLVSATGEGGQAALVARAAESDLALEVAGDLRIAQAAPAVLSALKQPARQRVAIRAAGALRLKEALPELLPLAANDDPALQREILNALVQIEDPASSATAVPFLTSNDLPLREAAVRLLSRFPASALSAATKLVESPIERDRRTGIALLAAVGTDEALSRIVPFLANAVPGLRLQALLALDGRVPPEARAKVAELRNDPDPLVRAVASRIAIM